MNNANLVFLQRKNNNFINTSAMGIAERALMLCFK